MKTFKIKMMSFAVGMAIISSIPTIISPGPSKRSIERKARRHALRDAIADAEKELQKELPEVTVIEEIKRRAYVSDDRRTVSKLSEILGHAQKKANLEQQRRDAEKAAAPGNAIKDAQAELAKSMPVPSAIEHIKQRPHVAEDPATIAKLDEIIAQARAKVSQMSASYTAEKAQQQKVESDQIGGAVGVAGRATGDEEKKSFWQEGTGGQSLQVNTEKHNGFWVMFEPLPYARTGTPAVANIKLESKRGMQPLTFRYTSAALLAPGKTSLKKHKIGVHYLLGDLEDASGSPTSYYLFSTRTRLLVGKTSIEVAIYRLEAGSFYDVLSCKTLDEVRALPGLQEVATSSKAIAQDATPDFISKIVSDGGVKKFWYGTGEASRV